MGPNATKLMSGLAFIALIVLGAACGFKTFTHFYRVLEAPIRNHMDPNQRTPREGVFLCKVKGWGVGLVVVAIGTWLLSM